MDQWAELLRLQQRQIQELTEAMQRQTAAIAALTKPELGYDLSVNELWAAYSPRLVRMASGATVRSMLKPAIKHFGPMLALALKTSDWEHYRDQVRAKATTLQGRPPAANTLNQELRYMKAMFNWGIADKRLGRNPFQGVKMLKVGPRETVITDDGEKDFLSVCHPLMSVMLVLGLDSGMRPGEMRMLEWSEVDLDRARVMLPWHKTKTRKARQPRLTARAVEALRSIPRVLGSPYVFANPGTRKPYSKSMIRNWWRDACAEAGVEAAPGDRHVHQHDGRHTAVTRMIRLVPVPVAMAQVGHESAAQTLRYTHVAESDLDELKRRMDEFLEGGRRRGPQRASADASESQPSRKKIVTTH